MNDATKLADAMADRDADHLPDDLRDAHPVYRTEGYRIEMADGSALVLISNRLGSWETGTVTVARVTQDAIVLDDPGADYAWCVEDGSERPRLMGSES